MTSGDPQNDLRKEIEGADDTGLVAGEELITQAETMLPLLRAQAAVPADELHAALPPGHEAHATIDKLHAALSTPIRSTTTRFTNTPARCARFPNSKRSLRTGGTTRRRNASSRS